MSPDWGGGQRPPPKVPPCIPESFGRVPKLGGGGRFPPASVSPVAGGTHFPPQGVTGPTGLYWEALGTKAELPGTAASDSCGHGEAGPGHVGWPWSLLGSPLSPPVPRGLFGVSL